MRIFSVLGVSALSLILAGCNSFMISEAEINQEVEKLLAQPQNNQISLLLEGNALDIDLVVKKADVDLTARNGGLVLVDLDTDLEGVLSAFGQKISVSADVVPSFESGVRIEEDRLYLTSPRITNIKVQGTSFSDRMLSSTLGTVHSALEKALVEYFDKHPVYVLNHSPFEKTAASLVKDIIIKEDSIELSIF
ncbi:DUF1439 domain-containing protein [Marinomonas sp.]|nr:DUF1439 domain-containing protein [Marinomonas sp.]MDB4837323.1 DUF1439 domain-containing protein [Marinomonas sp.]